MESNVILPDLQSAVICEDVRCEVNGMQTLVGVEFVLKEMEGHATNVHYFGGVQFQQYGMHHVEIYLENELQLRFPLPVIQVQQRPPG